MKKLMIAAAIVCVAAFAQASAIAWSSTAMKGGEIYGPDTTSFIQTWAGTKDYSITKAILMNTTDYTQSELLDGLRDGTYNWGDSKLDETAVNSSSKISSKTTAELSGLAGKDVSVYYAILATDAAGDQYVLFSTSKDVGVPTASGDSNKASWGTDGSTFSANNYGTADYSSAGWYAVAPEPTSGLLLLIGMAGLALRRRRA